ncbi:hypothetical protein [Embleya sp. NPDC059259]
MTVKECRRAGSARPDSRAIANQRHTVRGATEAASAAIRTWTVS